MACRLLVFGLSQSLSILGQLEINIRVNIVFILPVHSSNFGGSGCLR